MQLKILILVLLISSAVGYFYYTQNKIQSLTAQNAKVIQQNEQYKLAVNDLQNALRRQSEASMQLDRQAREAQALADEALSAINENNLELLSYSKPGLVERRINSATKKLFEGIENEINNY